MARNAFACKNSLSKSEIVFNVEIDVVLAHVLTVEKDGDASYEKKIGEAAKTN